MHTEPSARSRPQPYDKQQAAGAHTVYVAMGTPSPFTSNPAHADGCSWPVLLLCHLNY
jgi:hypothetical protein